jgi:hypothetical protein
MSKQKMMTLSMLAALCMLASLSMHAKAQSKESKPGQEGMVAVRDAQTGKLRAPTPQELRELRAKAPPASAAVAGAPQQQKTLTGRHGAHGVRLGEKTLVYDVVTRGEDGKLSSQCVHGDAAAQDALQHADHAQHEEHRHEAR